MKTFQISFMNGRVQNLMAEDWKRDTGVIRFRLENGGAVEFPSDDLAMIEELKGGDAANDVGPLQGEALEP